MRALGILILLPILAQAEVLYRATTEVDRFRQEHPDAVELRRGDGFVTFQMPSGERAVLLGQVSFLDQTEQLYDLVQPTIERIDGGYLQSGTPVVTYISDTADLSAGYTGADGQSYVAYLKIPGIRYVEKNAFAFTDRSLDWQIDLTPSGFDIRSQQIAATRGPQPYGLPFSVSDSVNLQVSADGDLVGSGGLQVTRPVMLGADGSRTPCSAWSINTSTTMVEFSCDDSTLPAEAYPYIIDPQTTLGALNYSSPVATAATYPPPTAQTYNSLFYPKRAYAGGSYTVSNAVVQWNTSSLGAGAVVTSATANTPVPSVVNANGCTLLADWWTGAVGGTNGYAATVPAATAMNAVALSSLGATSATYTLKNLGNVAVTGYTAVRFHVNCGATAPTGTNYVLSAVPTITLVYTPGTGSQRSRLISVSEN